MRWRASEDERDEECDSNDHQHAKARMHVYSCVRVCEEGVGVLSAGERRA
jgi:hypothetical protein